MSPPVHDRRWPIVGTALVAGILLFWLTLALVLRRAQAPVTAVVEAAPYTLEGKDLHPVTLSRRPVAPRVQVDVDPHTGEALTVSCTTCHATRAPNFDRGRGGQLESFHTELTFTHGGGTLACVSCHDPADYDGLRLADGSSLGYSEVVTLCAQCHSDQHRDYLHGAHGGMNGYWDLSRGGRTRHICIDCHDPHAPAFPRMQPTFKPRDKGLDAPERHVSATHTEDHHD